MCRLQSLIEATQVRKTKIILLLPVNELILWAVAKETRSSLARFHVLASACTNGSLNRKSCSTFSLGVLTSC